MWRQESSGVNQLDPESGLALLHVAAQSNDVNLIEELLEKEAGKYRPPHPPIYTVPAWLKTKQ